MAPRKHLLTLLLLLAAAVAMAQGARSEILGNRKLSASNYLAYPGPSRPLSPAPEGYRPFYISHYGRHGSRYLIDGEDYTVPVGVLSRADSLGKLTAFGRDVLSRVRLLAGEASGRYGELTPLGAEQLRGIARRMAERFPEVFEGEARIDARSTVVIRCILSMENALQELLRINPGLSVTHDASAHDMYYMNQRDERLEGQKMPLRAKVALEDIARGRSKHHRLMSRIFNDSLYSRYEVDGKDLYGRLFKLASNLQGTPLGEGMTLDDLFTDDEAYDNWLQANARWYVMYGACPLTGARQPFSQRNLLANIVSQADSCISLGRNGATLRFGHETMVLPLACLLDVNGYGMETDDLEGLDSRGWVNYRIFPMGANLQFVFYRRGPDDPDVLVKVLLNEDEATLPIDTDVAPYYRWEDVRRYCLFKLASFTE